MIGELGLQIALPMSMKWTIKMHIKQVENKASSSQVKHVDVCLKFIGDYFKKVHSKTDICDFE